ncbi:acyltransferase domain-containing protein, partial [Streptomyces iakyrus]|uniref:acyltransferase domain-containing protein n=1 Tax=Streptomyces iakyrus TaxID=68219 RepID=UPI0036B131DD
MVVGSDVEELARGLAGVAGAAAAPANSAARVGLLFTGQGAQWPGMGSGLCGFGVFREAFGEVCAGFDGLLSRSLGEVLGEGGEVVHQTEFAQAGLFAFEVAVFRLLRAWGVEPGVLVGHSVGEVAAAYCAGVWSLGDACRLVAARGRLMQALPAGGVMVSLRGSLAEVEALLGDVPQVAVAAVNGPRSVVISGAGQRVDELVARWEAGGGRARRLTVSHAFHSPLMEPMLDDFACVTRELDYRPPQIPLVSNVTGEVAEAATVCDPGYWVRHVREPVRFADGVWAARSAGVSVFMEVGPAAVLSVMGQECLPDDPVTWSALSRGPQAPAEALLSGVGAAFAAGAEVQWRQVFAGAGGRRV